jgi:hypothetical protein
MLTFAIKYGKNVYSQQGEDGIINEILLRLKLWNGTCVEFGGHDGYFCSNTRKLIDDGWKGFMYDMHPGSPDVICKTITVDNVNDLPQCEVLSIDTDGPDYEIWSAYKGKPHVVIVEINSGLPPMEEHFSRDKGASYISMLRLGISKGYFLVCHTGNLIFVKNEHRQLFPEILGDGIENHKKYFNTNWQ